MIGFKNAGRSSPASGGAARADCRGFTLTEVMIASAVVGIGIAGALAAMGSGLNGSSEGQALLTAQSLAENVWEYSKSLDFADPDGGTGFGPEEGEADLEDFDDLDDLDDLTLTPPIGPGGEELDNFPMWSQVVRVYGVDPATLEKLDAPVAPSLVLIEVQVFKKVKRAGSYRWLVARR